MGTDVLERLVRGDEDVQVAFGEMVRALRAEGVDRYWALGLRGGERGRGRMDERARD